MGKFDGVLFMSDYDDTFLGQDEVVPQANITAVKYFIENGGHFAISTGRAHRTFHQFAPQIPMNAPCVLSNGSTIYDFETDKLILQTYLSDTAREDFKKISSQFPDLGIETYYNEQIYAYNPNDVTYAHMKKVNASFTLATLDEMPFPWTKGVLEHEHDYLCRVRDFVLSEFGGKYEAIFSNPYLLEITDAGSHKGGMVEKVAQMLGVKGEDIYCVGDNENDIPMLKISAQGFAPENCAPAVRALAGIKVLSHCNKGVIADVISYLDTIY